MFALLDAQLVWYTFIQFQYWLAVVTTFCTPIGRISYYPFPSLTSSEVYVLEVEKYRE